MNFFFLFEGRKVSDWVVKFGTTQALVGMGNILDHYGRNGWELVAAGASGYGGQVPKSERTYVFKRKLDPVPPPPER